MSMLNPLARAKGHGSAKEGVHHWYAQRASAVLLIFLVGWIIFSVFSLAGGGYEASAAFIANPVNASFLGLLLIVALYHAMLGLQVVIEDYVHNPAAEIVLYFVTRAGAYVMMALGVVHIFKSVLGA
jgi:succinate dehydrogenase / fumarate reductase membrane anchor subunit